ncbi:MAG: hypothetical protein H6722_18910 [Sandaracinus sp.]|nr:hypothetical protein [Sandaracinus sp.]MCB9604400.1 hypothetical protein [Sandaracinus sp.]MCB9614514.1 hypothetical protein [Sandaracinus sp.]MCB9620993.1 hypothetical protein [Sandaracinus sp.]MCB9622919.1 hypothetical protein [Sandaracinus sp.]
MRPGLRLPPRDHERERLLARELEALEELLVSDREAAVARLDALAERTGHPCDETLVWAYASNGEETLLGLALPPTPRLREALTHDEQLELVRAWWTCAGEAFDLHAETWFRRVLEANLADPSSVPGATSPEDFLARALAQPKPAGMPAPDSLGPQNEQQDS